MRRIILTVWTDSIINVLTRQSWERFCNNSILTCGISNKYLQSFGKDGLLPFLSSYPLSRFRSTLQHNCTSRTTENRQFWRTSLEKALQTWSAFLASASVSANFLDPSVQTLACVAYSSYVHINPNRYTQTFPRLLYAQRVALTWPVV